MNVPLKNDHEHFNYTDYLTWPEDERWELIRGIPFEMSAAPNRFHQEISGDLFNIIKNYLKDKKCRVYAAPFDVRFAEANQADDEIETVLQPDISVICNTSKLDDKGCKGAPDFVVEILSPFTSKMDRMIKFHVYEHFGVKEYWLVSPGDKTVEVFLLGDNGKYGRPEFYSETEKENIIPCHVLEGLKIKVEEIFVGLL
ncbi:MAG: Uma2 family endonuclease [bacterium]|nr:Uma2 family endonuclease [bacterium]